MLNKLESRNFKVVPSQLHKNFLVDKYKNVNEKKTKGEDALYFFKFLVDKFNEDSNLDDLLNNNITFKFQHYCCKNTSEDNVCTVFFEKSNKISKVFQTDIKIKCSFCNQISKKSILNYPDIAVFCLKNENEKEEHNFLNVELDYMKLDKYVYSVSSIVKYNKNHFYSIVRDGELWYQIDDENVSKIMKNNLLDSDTYMVFLKKIKDKVKKKLIFKNLNNKIFREKIRN